MVFSPLHAWKQPLESLDLVFERMSFLILNPINTTSGAAMEMSLIL